LNLEWIEIDCHYLQSIDDDKPPVFQEKGAIKDKKMKAGKYLRNMGDLYVLK
jgi:hypothetical protein